MAMQGYEQVRERLPVGLICNYLTENFYSSTGDVMINEFFSGALCEVDTLTSILGCECLMRPFFNLAKFFKNVGVLLRSIVPKVENFLELSNFYGWNCALSRERVRVSIPVTCCNLCEKKILFGNCGPCEVLAAS